MDQMTDRTDDIVEQFVVRPFGASTGAKGAQKLTDGRAVPLHGDTVRACMGADVMMGHDPDCSRWIRKFREPPPPGAAGDNPAARGRREGGLRRRSTGGGTAG